VLKEKSTIDELIAKGYVVTPGDGAGWRRWPRPTTGAG
jgi:hypothetical protein